MWEMYVGRCYLWSIRNFVGQDGSKYVHNWKGDIIPQGAKDNMNRFRDEDGIKGLYMFSEGVDKLSHQELLSILLRTGIAKKRL